MSFENARGGRPLDGTFCPASPSGRHHAVDVGRNVKSVCRYCTLPIERAHARSGWWYEQLTVGNRQSRQDGARRLPVYLTSDELTALRFAADSAKNSDDNRTLHGVVRRARIVPALAIRRANDGGTG